MKKIFFLLIYFCAVFPMQNPNSAIDVTQRLAQRDNKLVYTLLISSVGFLGGAGYSYVAGSPRLALLLTGIGVVSGVGHVLGKLGTLIEKNGGQDIIVRVPCYDVYLWLYQANMHICPKNRLADICATQQSWIDYWIKNEPLMQKGIVNEFEAKNYTAVSALEQKLEMLAPGKEFDKHLKFRMKLPKEIRAIIRDFANRNVIDECKNLPHILMRRHELKKILERKGKINKLLITGTFEGLVYIDNKTYCNALTSAYILPTRLQT